MELSVNVDVVDLVYQIVFLAVDLGEKEVHGEEAMEGLLCRYIKVIWSILRKPERNGTWARSRRFLKRKAVLKGDFLTQDLYVLFRFEKNLLKIWFL